MNALTTVNNLMPAMTDDQQSFVDSVTTHIKDNLPIVQCLTHHTIHNGIYSRTVLIPAGTIVTGVLIKVPTTVIISGRVNIFIGDKVVGVDGYDVVTAGANRKQIVYAEIDSYVTLSFPTEAKTVEEAEEEMTDEYEQLQSRLEDSVNIINIGE